MKEAVTKTLDIASPAPFSPSALRDWTLTEEERLIYPERRFRRIHYKQLTTVLIETPTLVLVYSPLTDTVGFSALDCMATLEASRAALGHFHALEQMLLRKRCLSEIRKTHQFISCLRSASILKLRRVHLASLPLFQADGEPLAIKDVGRLFQKGASVRFLLHLHSVWVSADYFGLDIRVLQIQWLDPVAVSMNPAWKCESGSGGVAWDTYERMIRSGVPLPAILHKMAKDGLEATQPVVRIIHAVVSSGIVGGGAGGVGGIGAGMSLLPPPPLPSAPSKAPAMGRPALAFLDGIKAGGIKLKSVGDGLKTATSASGSLKETKREGFQPALADILAIRQRLKRVGDKNLLNE